MFCIDFFSNFALSKRNGVLLMEKRHVATRETAFHSETDRVMTKGATFGALRERPNLQINLKKLLTTMGTIQIKKVEKTVTTGKMGENRQKVKKTYGKIIYRGTLSLNCTRLRP